MTEDQSDRVFRYFKSCTQDLTPATAQEGANVLYAPCSHDPEVTRFCSSILAESELCRADRLVLEADKQRFVQRRAFRRYCGATTTSIALPLSQIVFEETENGRPYLAGLPDLWFSFSSSEHGFLGARSSNCAIGVDLEDRSRKLETAALARHFFSEHEASAVERICEPDRLSYFLKLWCLKEAALKSIGEGLPFGLDVFQFEIEPVLQITQTPAEHGGPDRFSAHFVEKNYIFAALVLRSLDQGASVVGDVVVPAHRHGKQH